MIVVVMGVSGAGKTAVGSALAARLGCGFFDADDFHPEANVAKMASGVPLTDEDRRPWLARLNALLREHEMRGASAVLACSALRQAYRDRLAAGLAHCRIVYLKGSAEMIGARLARRSNHYMPASLLQSQFAALEPPAQAIEIDAAESVAACVEAICARLEATG